jgi:hypothetical protein
MGSLVEVAKAIALDGRSWRKKARLTDESWGEEEKPERRGGW